MYDTMVYYGTSSTQNIIRVIYYILLLYYITIYYYSSDILYITTVLYRLPCNVLYGLSSSTHIMVVTVHIYYLLIPCNKSYTTRTSQSSSSSSSD
jgi:hypothetical protein